MKLYLFPGSCSQAVHIALHETGVPFETEAIDLFAKKCADGSDYRRINAKGSVPALRLDDGSVLTEVAALLQYVADLRPEAGLFPPAGTIDRYRVIEALSYVGTEVHKTFGVQFTPGVPDAWKAASLERLRGQLDHLAGQLAAREWIVGTRYSIADVYLYVVLGWAPHVGLDLAQWPALAAYRQRVGARAAVQRTLRAEGIPA